MQNENLALGVAVCAENALNEKANCLTADLTDGKIGDIKSDFGWMSLLGGATNFVLDLGKSFAISGFSVGFAHGEACPCPENVKLLLSDDGINFYEVASIKAPYPASFKVETRTNYSVELPSIGRARFVKIKFRVESLAKCDEIRVFGRELSGDESCLSGVPTREINKNCLASKNALAGCVNIPLLKLSEQPFGRDELRPYIAYMNRSGATVDTMFDSVAFCLRKDLTQNEDITLLSDWEAVIDELFLPNANLKALDEEFSSVKKALQLDRNQKLKIFLQAPVPKCSFSAFGDLNGDGIKEKLLTTEDCIAAFNWFVDAVTRRFNAECLPNLKIAGFVWNDDKISRVHRDDEAFFVRECVSGLHNRGYKTLFVNNQNCGGAEIAEKLGIDCTTLLPTCGRIDQSVASVCKKYALGICLSVDENNASELLADFSSNGLMNTVHSFANAESLFEFCYSDNQAKRDIYDNVYNFIKQASLLKSEPVEITPKQVEAVQPPVQEPEAVEEFEVIVEKPRNDFFEPTSEQILSETVPEELPEEEELETTAEEIFEEQGTAEEVQRAENSSEKKIIPEVSTVEFKQYEVPTLKIEISVPSAEPSCPDRRCGHCKKFEPTVEEKARDLVKKCDKKVALAAAGIALTLGAAYIIAKSTKGKDNG